MGQITRLCGYLPLAIGMVARQLHHHPAWTVGGRAAELAGAAGWGEVLSEDLPTQLTWLRAGSMMAGYRLEVQVSAGGMPVVFRARDERGWCTGMSSRRTCWWMSTRVGPITCTCRISG